jgi:hypothetical protein
VAERKIRLEYGGNVVPKDAPGYRRREGGDVFLGMFREPLPPRAGTGSGRGDEGAGRLPVWQILEFTGMLPIFVKKGIEAPWGQEVKTMRILSKDVNLPNF